MCTTWFYISTFLKIQNNIKIKWTNPWELKFSDLPCQGKFYFCSFQKQNYTLRYTVNLKKKDSQSWKYLLPQWTHNLNYFKRDRKTKKAVQKFRVLHLCLWWGSGKGGPYWLPGVFLPKMGIISNSSNIHTLFNLHRNLNPSELSLVPLLPRGHFT